MLHLSICLLILFGTILAEEQAQLGRPLQVTPRLFPILEQLRKSFCSSFCTSADTMPYIANLVCAAKCPELYLPHSTTTESLVSTTAPPTTPVPFTTATTVSTSTTMSTTPRTTMTTGMSTAQPPAQPPVQSPAQQPATVSTSTTISTTPSTATSQNSTQSSPNP